MRRANLRTLATLTQDELVFLKVIESKNARYYLETQTLLKINISENSVELSFEHITILA